MSELRSCVKNESSFLYKKGETADDLPFFLIYINVYFSLYITLLAPLVICIASGCSLMNVSMWRMRLSSRISSTAMRMPVSSTSPKPSLMAVPKSYIVGESPM